MVNPLVPFTVGRPVDGGGAAAEKRGEGYMLYLLWWWQAVRDASIFQMVIIRISG